VRQIVRLLSGAMNNVVSISIWPTKHFPQFFTFTFSFHRLTGIGEQ
jgi:hypothetical protein